MPKLFYFKNEASTLKHRRTLLQNTQPATIYTTLPFPPTPFSFFNSDIHIINCQERLFAAPFPRAPAWPWPGCAATTPGASAACPQRALPSPGAAKEGEYISGGKATGWLRDSIDLLVVGVWGIVIHLLLDFLGLLWRCLDGLRLRLRLHRRGDRRGSLRPRWQL